MSEGRRNTLVGVAVVVVLAAIYGAYRIGQKRVEAPVGADSMATRIKKLGFSPLPSPQRRLEPGAAYRLNGSRLVPFGAAEEVFESPSWLPEGPESWNEMLRAATFADAVSTKGEATLGVESFLGLGSLSTSFEHEGVVRISTTVDRLEKWEISELALQQARLRRAALGGLQGGGILVVQGVLRARGLEIAFETRDRMLDRASVEAFVGSLGTESGTEVTSDGHVRYEDLVIGYYDNPWFIAALPADVDAATAATEVAARLEAVEDVKARVTDGAILVQASTERIPLVAKLTETGVALARESRQATLARQEAETARADFGRAKLELERRDRDVVALQQENREQAMRFRDEQRAVTARFEEQLTGMRQAVETYREREAMLQRRLQQLEGGGLRPGVPEVIDEARAKVRSPVVRSFVARRRQELRRELEGAVAVLNRSLGRSFTVDAWVADPERVARMVEERGDPRLGRQLASWQQLLAEMAVLEAAGRLGSE